ncbi:helix-turn-helix domain-containing protein [Desulfonatronum thiodismutans]|uniref:helix-turn-helix domain-containing protein n=1 Tax=Desulfonatronum thiodismutans TaxID=159290 RepID=UPI0012687878|nr:helix-turn-helix transcriptional regulator [Desulfonatronum thiodismutans]
MNSSHLRMLRLQSYPPLAHAGFILWLMTFPLGLLVEESSPFSVLYFLLPHSLTLLLLARCVHKAWFPKFADLSIFLTISLTLLFPYFREWTQPLLIVTGFCGAALLIRLGLLHSRAENPIFSAALGQSMGIAALFLIPILQLPLPAKFILVALPLILFLNNRRELLSMPAKATGTDTLLFRALPIIFLFFMTSGLTHGLLLPFYIHASLLPGSELAFYVIGLLIGYRLTLARIHLPLTLAIVLTVFAFGIWQSPDRLAVDISMYAMNMSKGFADIYLLALMLGQRNVAQSFALGTGIMLLGVSAGIFLAHALEDEAWAFVLVGNVLVCATLLAFFLQGSRRNVLAPTAHRSNEIRNGLLEDKIDLEESSTKTHDSSSAQSTPLPTSGPLASEAEIPSIPTTSLPPLPFLNTLSRQERCVLELVLSGANYKQAAKRLEITESSVKTYMTRIYSKANVRNKAELLRKYL